VCPAQLRLALGLCFVIVNGQPLHILWCVRTSAFERGYMVDLPAGARESVLASGRAGGDSDEFVTGSGASLGLGDRVGG